MGASIQFANATPDAKQLRKEAGRWLQAQRKRAGLSQIQLAEKLGLKYYTFISQVENGRPGTLRQHARVGARPRSCAN